MENHPSQNRKRNSKTKCCQEFMRKNRSTTLPKSNNMAQKVLLDGDLFLKFFN